MINQTNISKATLLTSRRLQKSAIYFLLFAICLLGFNLEAQQAFSLEEAQDYGLKNSIQIKKDQIEIAKAKE